jgi:hypothetical protein
VWWHLVVRALSAVLGVGLTVSGVSGCVRSPDGSGDNAFQPVPGDRIARSIGTELPPIGSCMTARAFTKVDCAEPHDVEVAAIQTLPDPGGTPFPGEAALSALAIPRCRAELPGYLGGPAFDATRLQSWVFWPSPADWERGERWLLCSAIEIGGGGKSTERTGQLHGTLGADGFLVFQTCTTGSPSKDARLRTVTCDQPHQAEAVPDILTLGTPADRIPSKERMNVLARGHCDRAVASYLAVANRRDVISSWRLPTQQSWEQGYTSVVCYAEANSRITGRLNRIGNQSLPK